MDDLLDRITSVLTAVEKARIAASLPGPVPIPSPVPPSPIPPVLPQPPGIRKLVSGLTHEYSTMYPGDVVHRGVLLQHPGGSFGLHFLDTGKLYAMMPGGINHSSQPRWRRTKPDCFLYLYLNELREHNPGNHSTTVIRKFDLPNINGMGESDISEDDDHLVLCSGRHIFVYELSTNRIIREVDAPADFNNLYLSSDNRPVIGFYGSAGIQILDHDGRLRKVAGKLGHMDCSSDASGNPIMVWTNSDDDTGPDRRPALVDCQNGIVKVDLNTGKQTCLASLDWSLAVHISLPHRATFALVTTYDPRSKDNPLPEANALLKVNIDGSGYSVLAKHGSKADVYDRQPKASVSPDGTRYIYDSNGDVFVGTI